MKDLVFNPASNPPNPANPELIVKYIADVSNYINSDPIGKQLFAESKKSKTKKYQYEKHMEKRFKDFSDNFYSTFSLVIQNEGIPTILMMVESLFKIKSGNSSVDKEEGDITNKLMDKFGVKDVLKNISKK